MVKVLIFREKYTAPKMEADVLAPEILCESPTSELENPGYGEPWTF